LIPQEDQQVAWMIPENIILKWQKRGCGGASFDLCARISPQQ
jgi:hypothetical protein